MKPPSPAQPPTTEQPQASLPTGTGPAVSGAAAGAFGSQRINEQVLQTEPELDETDENDADVDPHYVVRTALAVEARHGRLYVFMPPTQRLEDYLDLVEAIEQTASLLKLPVLLEGYLPPHDHRVSYFKVTPDPGVIEVNTQPSSTWRELTEVTTTLYDEARKARLGTEKFDLTVRILVPAVATIS